MFVPSARHPRAEELQAFGQGRLAPEAAADVERHIAECESCCRLLEVAPGDSFEGRLRQAVPATATTVDSASGTLVDAPDIPAELTDHPRYRVVALLGQGGMGAVYRAEHRRMERLVALKVINPGLIRNPATVQRFQQEVRAAARLHHPNIVTAFDADQAGEWHFLVMEYIEGRSLADLVGERGPLPIAEACAYARQAALGLQHAHEQGMVHRDIKPHNLMVTGVRGREPEAGESSKPVVKILDFGLARLARTPIEAAPIASTDTPAPLTSAGTVMGTADYIAPEQAVDPRTADIRADIYSLGCTLFYLLTGRAPFPNGGVQDKIAKHETAPLPSLAELRPDAPSEIAAVLARMTAKDPAQRYSTPAEVAVALAPFAFSAPPGRERSRVSGQKRRLSLLVGAAALLVAALLLGGVVVRLITNRGEIIVQTDDDSLELTVKKGRVIRIRDTKSGEAWDVDARNYQIARADAAEGLTMELPQRGTLTLRRRGGGRLTVTTEGEDIGDARAPTVESEIAVARGLNWLVRAQSPNGAWPLDGNFAQKSTMHNDIAGTAFGLLPFLGYGKTHKEAKDNAFAKTVDKGLQFLIRKQSRRDGYLGGGMYAHALATMALCEAYGRSQDPALKSPAQLAVNYIVEAQHELGGWRYEPKQAGDTSVAGWQVQALRAARAAGLEVPQKTWNGAITFLDSVCDQDDEGYRYLPQSAPTPTMTAVGLLCRQHLQAWDRKNPRLVKGIRSHLEPRPPPEPGGAPLNMYYFYYATQVMHNFGGAKWKAWNEKMRVSLTTSQDQSNDPLLGKGSWAPATDPHSKTGGRLMHTSLCLLTLEVYYRDRWMDAPDRPRKRDESKTKP